MVKYYWNRVDEGAYNKMRDEQKLNIELVSLPNLLMKIFNNCQKDPNS